MVLEAGREEPIRKEPSGENPFPTADWTTAAKIRESRPKSLEHVNVIAYGKRDFANVTTDFETESPGLSGWALSATTSVLTKGAEGITGRGGDGTVKQRLEWLGNTPGRSAATRNWQRQRNRLSLGASRRNQPCKVQYRLLSSRTVREQVCVVEYP